MSRVYASDDQVKMVVRGVSCLLLIVVSGHPGYFGFGLRILDIFTGQNIVRSATELVIMMTPSIVTPLPSRCECQTSSSWRWGRTGEVALLMCLNIRNDAFNDQ